MVLNGEIIMDDAQCGENIKSWVCAVIVNGTKEKKKKNDELT